MTADLRNWFPNPRWKTYAAQSGYVYQYLFQGLRGEEEYVFRAVSGPSIEITLEVILEGAALEEWVRDNRVLTGIERFGVAKMALLRALDGENVPNSPRTLVRPTAPEVAAICHELDL